VHKQILLSSIDLALGETSYNHNCPVCGEKGSFSITKISEGILYNCFRAKCGTKGFVPSLTGMSPHKKQEINKHDKIIPRLTFVSLPTKVRLYLKKRFYLSDKQLYENQIKWCINNNRVVTPLYSIHKKYYGIQLRSYSNNTKVKAVVYTTANKELYCPLNIIIKRRGDIVLVEDTWSAIRLSYFVPTVALLGTSLSASSANALAGKSVYIALDNDATHKALKTLQFFGSIFDSYSTVVLSRDIKNMSDDRIIKEVIPQIYGKEINSSNAYKQRSIR